MSDIRTHPATPEYRDNWERIFGKPKRAKAAQELRFQAVQKAIREKVIPIDHPDFEAATAAFKEEDYEGMAAIYRVMGLLD